jgi:hypothetical protein
LSLSVSSGQNLVFAGLSADEFAETGTDHGNVRTRFVFLVPELSFFAAGPAALGPDEMRLAQDLGEHRVDRLRVRGAQAAQRRLADHLRPQISA